MDTKTVGIIGTVVKFGIAIGGLIISFLMLFKGVDGKNERYVEWAIDLSIYVIIATAAIALLFAVYYFVTNIKSSVGALIGMAGLGIIVAIAYSMSSSALSPGWAEEGITPSISRMAETGINTFLILIGVAVVAAVSTEVLKIVK